MTLRILIDKFFFYKRDHLVVTGTTFHLSYITLSLYQGVLRWLLFHLGFTSVFGGTFLIVEILDNSSNTLYPYSWTSGSGFGLCQD